MDSGSAAQGRERSSLAPQRLHGFLGIAKSYARHIAVALDGVDQLAALQVSTQLRIVGCRRARSAERCERRLRPLAWRHLDELHPVDRATRDDALACAAATEENPDAETDHGDGDDDRIRDHSSSTERRRGLSPEAQQQTEHMIANAASFEKPIVTCGATSA